jgi:hypothetical protein
MDGSSLPPIAPLSQKHHNPPVIEGLKERKKERKNERK